MSVSKEKRIRKGGKRDGLFQRNGWWWLDYYDADGKRHRKKGSPSHEVAKAMLRETKVAITKGEVLGVREENIRFQEFADKKYWPTIRSTLSAGEQTRAKGILDKQLKPAFEGTRLLKMRREQIERWYTGRLSEVTPATANKELMRLKHLLNRAVAWGYLKSNPAKGMKKAKEAPGRVRFLTPDEREALLREANPALRLYLLTALHTGARKGELRALKWEDVDMRARTITFRHTKNGDSRSVPMTDTLREALSALPRPINPDTPVLPAKDPEVIRKSFSRLVKRLGIQDLRFHDLRHDAASTLTMAGVSQRAVMEILGHKDPRMTVRYQHLEPGHLREAMNSLDIGWRDKKREILNQ